MGFNSAFKGLIANIFRLPYNAVKCWIIIWQQRTRCNFRG